MTGALIRLLLALLLLGGSVVAYGLWYQSVASVSAHVAELSERIETKTVTQKRVASIRASLTELAEQEVLLGKYFISPDTIASFLQSLQGEASSSGASVSVLSVAPATFNGQSTLQISLSITGSFSAVMRTIGSMEYAPYYLSINSFSLGLGGVAENPEEKSAEPLWRASLTLMVGYVPMGGDTGATPAPAKSQKQITP